MTDYKKQIIRKSRRFRLCNCGCKEEIQRDHLEVEVSEFINMNWKIKYYLPECYERIQKEQNLPPLHCLDGVHKLHWAIQNQLSFSL